MADPEGPGGSPRPTPRATSGKAPRQVPHRRDFAPPVGAALSAACCSEAPRTESGNVASRRRSAARERPRPEVSSLVRLMMTQPHSPRPPGRPRTRPPGPAGLPQRSTARSFGGTVWRSLAGRGPAESSLTGRGPAQSGCPGPQSLHYNGFNFESCSSNGRLKTNFYRIMKRFIISVAISCSAIELSSRAEEPEIEEIVSDERAISEWSARQHTLTKSSVSTFRSRVLLHVLWIARPKIH